ncbi:MAG: DUF362 domain-containing protein, partial [Anaerolineales bacterium]|nr:DUF362 domain-containing protein [Anaerolineales bacterium]
AFNLAGLDVANYGTADWNPLKELIKPGETVLLKPNLVKETHPRDPVGWTYVLTHGSIIRAVADYVWKALQGEGKVILGDAPQTDSSFSTIAKLLGLNELSEFYASLGLDFEIVDLRKEEWVNQGDVIVARNKLSGDPHGYISFDLGSKSEFAEHSGEGHYYGADYDAGEVNYHHSGGRHEYLIAGTAVHADVIFSLPKLKTHKKAGITVSLKNLVGINGDKNWLPHHTEGDPSTGGDERPFLDMKDRSERSIVPVFRWFSLNIPGLGPQIHRFARRLGSHLYGDTEDIVRSGNWWGNDTVWRMCLDLNKIVLYGNPDGTFRSEEPLSQKRHYVLVDGILAGEGRGPMNPDPVPAGIIVFGIHPASVDAACAYLMGFDPENIPIVRQAFLCDHFPLAQWNWRDVTLLSNKPAWNGILPDIPDDSTLKFKPHFGWIGHIERSSIREESYDIP